MSKTQYMPLYLDFKQNEDYKHQKSETTRKIALEYELCFGYIFVVYIFGAFRVSLSPVFICSTASKTENALDFASLESICSLPSMSLSSGYRLPKQMHFRADALLMRLLIHIRQ
jgi:hypothetical protein